MAQAFADAYRSIPWTDIYVSPMKRAVATAQPLCDAVGLPMQIREGLREIDYGAWEDRELDYVQQHYEDDFLRWQTDPAWNPPTGGETAVQIAARTLPVITEIESRYKDGNVLLYPIKPPYASFFAAFWVLTWAATGIVSMPSLPLSASSI